MQATLCTSPFGALCPVQGVTSSRRHSQSLPTLRLMLKGKLLVRAADFFPPHSLTFQPQDGSKGRQALTGTYKFVSPWLGGQIRAWEGANLYAQDTEETRLTPLIRDIPSVSAEDHWKLIFPLLNCPRERLICSAFFPLLLWCGELGCSLQFAKDSDSDAGCPKKGDIK
ncbi:hypothetical protein Q5P01_006801 [Channa striata]|uniref:Uncharacterized protein n=1 Tax=Channa striata TaxID=64152 RepID=A0AA88N9L4_CHASR|nr:hypothetical protein Q5P01_006801 [Channa striata]